MIDSETRYALFCDGVPTREDCQEFLDVDGFSDDPYQHESRYESRQYAPRHGWEVRNTDDSGRDLCPKCIEERDRTETEKRTGTRYPENGGVDPRFGTALTLDTP